MNIYEKLLNIQTELKAPKGQENKFGHYKYRSCEDILEAVKPLLAKNKATLQLTDKIENLGNRYYIKATAILIDTEDTKNGEIACIENTAYARESEEKKGMDDSQITGTASSYARKYALNGLFCIDDTKDADTNEFKEQQDKSDKDNQKQTEVTEENIDDLVTEQQAKTVYAIMKQKGLDVEKQLFTNYNITNTKDLTKKQYASILNAIKDMPNKK
ncbi:MAG: ERF family protein [Clostridia bacterium]|nr:ERF family protein [Clostridia bacterium]